MYFKSPRFNVPCGCQRCGVQIAAHNPRINDSDANCWWLPTSSVTWPHASQRDDVQKPLSMHSKFESWWRWSLGMHVGGGGMMGWKLRWQNPSKWHNPLVWCVSKVDYDLAHMSAWNVSCCQRVVVATCGMVAGCVRMAMEGDRHKVWRVSWARILGPFICGTML